MANKDITEVKKLFNKTYKNSLPIVILGQPKILNINAVGKRNCIMLRADDAIYIEDARFPSINYIFGAAIILFALFCFFLGKNSKDIEIFVILSFIIAAFQFIYGFTMPKKEIILDRQNGMFTYPGFLWGKPITIPFKDTVAYIAAGGWPPMLTLRVPRPSGIVFTLGQDDQIETWNLFVWYMDKNRPLPPGTAFDPYRQKDYERRKAEGFPSPFYESLIRTPEDPKDTPQEKLSDPGYNYYG